MSLPSLKYFTLLKILMIKNLYLNYYILVLLLLLKCHLHSALLLVVLFPVTCILRITMALVVWNECSHISNYIRPLSNIVPYPCGSFNEERNVTAKCHQWDIFTHFLKIWLKYYPLEKNYLKVHDSPAKINYSFICSSIKFYIIKIMHHILPAFIKYVYVQKVINLRELCFNIFL